MEKAEIKVSVAVEAGIHEAMTEFAQEVFDKYGVQIQSAKLDWLEISGITHHRATVSCVQMDTKRVAVI